MSACEFLRVHTASVEELRMTANSIMTFTESHSRIARTCDPPHYILLQPISPSLIKKRSGQSTKVDKKNISILIKHEINLNS